MGASPSRVILMRHAEKTGQRGDRGLSEPGRRRARALAAAIPRQLGAIDQLIAARSAPNSARPELTLAPLAAATGLKVDASWETKGVEALAHGLLSDDRYRDRRVLVCWRHDWLGQLARALGARDAPEWDEAVYGRFWIITFSDAGAALRDVPQDLSPADGPGR